MCIRFLDDSAGTPHVWATYRIFELVLLIMLRLKFTNRSTSCIWYWCRFIYKSTSLADKKDKLYHASKIDRLTFLCVSCREESRSPHSRGFVFIIQRGRELQTCRDRCERSTSIRRMRNISRRRSRAHTVHCGLSTVVWTEVWRQSAWLVIAHLSVFAV